MKIKADRRRAARTAPSAAARTTRTPWVALTLVGVAALVGVGSTRSQTSAPTVETDASESARVRSNRRGGGEERGRRERVRWSDVREASTRPSEGAVPVLSALPTAAPLEVAGAKGARTIPNDQLDAHFHEGAEDVEASAAVLAHATEMFEDFDVHPAEVEVTCTRDVCRSRLSFASLEEMRRLIEIPHSQEDFRVDAPEQTPSGLALSVYWERLDGPPF